MKIVYLSNSIIPSRTANSVHVMKMCQAFAKNGHEVILIAPDKPSETVTDLYQFYGVDSCFKIIRKPWLKTKGRAYIYGWLATKLAKQLNPDIIYSRSIIGSFFATLIGMPVSFEIHQPIEDSGKLSSWMFHRLINSNYLKQLVLITNSLQDYYRNQYPQLKCKVQVSPDGADPISDEIRPIQLPNQNVRLQVGYVGHLYQGKGMEVISQLAHLSPWADFHIVGGVDRDVKFWQKQCSDLSNIYFWGYVPHQETVRYNLAFDLVLLPNQEFVGTAGEKNKANISQWTSPLKAFEYMAAGKPIICSDLPVLREVFEHNVNALLCPPTDLTVWQTALEDLRDDEKLRKRLGKTAKQIFLEKFSWQARAKNILEDIGQ